jgi:hypothetical protein
MEGGTMPWSVKKPTAAEIAPDWLQPYCKQFMRDLAEQGYAQCSLRLYDRAAAIFCSEVARHGLRSDQLAGAIFQRVRAGALRKMRRNKYDERKYCLERFISMLVDAGAAQRPTPPQKAPSAIERLRAEYEAYLREQRGLTDATIYHCIRFLYRFMTFRFGDRLGDLNDIGPDDVVRFLREVMGRKSPYRDKTPPTHLRNLFRFLFWSGKTTRDLASSLPRVATGRASHLSRSLQPEEIERLLDAVWARTRSAGATTRC